MDTLQVTLTIDNPATARGEVMIVVGTSFVTTDGLVRRATSAISEVRVVLLNYTTEVRFVGRD